MGIEPKEINIDGKTFIIHKLPATVAIEIMFKFGNGVLPKIGNFALAEEMMVKMMSYASLKRPNLPDLPLSTRELIDNHCVDYKTYLKVLEEVRRYSELFLISGNSLDFLKSLIAMLPAKLASISSQLSPVSSTESSPPSTN